MVYLAVGVYARVVEALNIEVLMTEPGGLEVTLRDGWALALYGVTTVVAGATGRGAVLPRAGVRRVWPSGASSRRPSFRARCSRFRTSMPATIVPFIGGGMTMSWLYWRSGSLWDAIAFHMLFNLLTFILLIART